MGLDSGDELSAGGGDEHFDVVAVILGLSRPFHVGNGQPERRVADLDVAEIGEHVVDTLDRSAALQLVFGREPDLDKCFLE